MSYITLEQAKKHLAVFHDADDDIIQTYIDAAEQYACDFMNRSSLVGEQEHLWHTINEASPSDMEPPQSVVVAILLLMADYYEHRTATSDRAANKNPAVEQILHFQRVCVGV